MNKNNQYLKQTSGNQGIKAKQLNGITFQDDSELQRKIQEQGCKVTMLTKGMVSCTWKGNKYDFLKEMF